MVLRHLVPCLVETAVPCIWFCVNSIACSYSLLCKCYSTAFLFEVTRWYCQYRPRIFMSSGLTHSSVWYFSFLLWKLSGFCVWFLEARRLMWLRIFVECYVVSHPYKMDPFPCETQPGFQNLFQGRRFPYTRDACGWPSGVADFSSQWCRYTHSIHRQLSEPISLSRIVCYTGWSRALVQCWRRLERSFQSENVNAFLKIRPRFRVTMFLGWRSFHYWDCRFLQNGNWSIYFELRKLCPS
jgi:hypothetical protein